MVVLYELLKMMPSLVCFMFDHNLQLQLFISFTEFLIAFMFSYGPNTTVLPPLPHCDPASPAKACPGCPVSLHHLSQSRHSLLAGPCFPGPGVPGGLLVYITRAAEKGTSVHLQKGLPFTLLTGHWFLEPRSSPRPSRHSSTLSSSGC